MASRDKRPQEIETLTHQQGTVTDFSIGCVRLCGSGCGGLILQIFSSKPTYPLAAVGEAPRAPPALLPHFRRDPLSFIAGVSTI